MTIEDGHFRTDGCDLEPCCWECDMYVNGNGSDEGVWIPSLNGTKDTYFVKIWIQQPGIVTERDYISFCPFCGAKLEYVEELK